MGKVLAGITISVDGFITGPRDDPGCGLGVGGERAAVARCAVIPRARVCRREQH